MKGFIGLLILFQLKLLLIQASWLNDFPSKCYDFNDTRTNKGDGILNITTIEIPAEFTGTGKESLKFNLKSSSRNNDANFHEDLCELMKLNVSYFEFNLSNSKSKFSFHVRSNPRYFTEPPPQSMYFTSDGYVYKDGHYYNPDDYCVLNISDTKLVLKVCQVDCSANLTSSYWYTSTPAYSSSRICIPKCCGLDETLSSKDSKCRKLNDNEPFYFLPYLYLPDPIHFFKDDNDPADHFELILFNGLKNWKRSIWNSTTALSAQSSLLKYLHFFRNSKMGMRCGLDGEKKGHLVKEIFKYDDIKTKKERRQVKLPYRLEVSSKNVVPSHLTKSRKWARYYGDFCVDGVDHWGNAGISQVIVMCNPYEDDTKEDSIFASTDAVVISAPDFYLSEFTIHWVYAAVSIFSCFILMLAVIMYASLRNALTLQGCVVVGHLMSMFLSYVFLTIGHLVFLGNFQRDWNNHEKFVKQEGDDKTMGVICYAIGIVTHIYQLSTYFWLTMMNSKVVQLVPIPFLKRVASSREEASANKWLAFRILQSFAWGPPGLIVIAFMIVDIVYSDPFSDVHVPDYAVKSCHVATWSAGYYVHLPIGILLGISFLGLLHRFMLSCHRAFQVDGVTKMAHLRAQENEEYFSPHLFRAVWFIQCISWFITFLVWFEEFMGIHDIDWLVTTCAFITLLGEPLALMFLYCMNDKILEKFTGRYPSMLGIIKFLRKCHLVWKGDGLVGNCCKEEFSGDKENEDTVVIEAAAEEAIRMRSLKDSREK